MGSFGSLRCSGPRPKGQGGIGLGCCLVVGLVRALGFCRTICGTTWCQGCLVLWIGFGLGWSGCRGKPQGIQDQNQAHQKEAGQGVAIKAGFSGHVGIGFGERLEQRTQTKDVDNPRYWNIRGETGCQQTKDALAIRSFRPNPGPG